MTTMFDIVRMAKDMIPAGSKVSPEEIEAAEDDLKDSYRGLEPQQYSVVELRSFSRTFKRLRSPFGFLLMAQACMNMPEKIAQLCFGNFRVLNRAQNVWSTDFIIEHLLENNEGFSEEFTELLLNYDTNNHYWPYKAVRHGHCMSLRMLNRYVLDAGVNNALKQYFEKYPQKAAGICEQYPHLIVSENKDNWYKVMPADVMQKFPQLFPEQWKALPAFKYCNSMDDITQFLKQET